MLQIWSDPWVATTGRGNQVAVVVGHGRQWVRHSEALDMRESQSDWMLKGQAWLFPSHRPISQI